MSFELIHLEPDHWAAIPNPDSDHITLTHIYILCILDLGLNPWVTISNQDSGDIILTHIYIMRY